jgi:prevent-host-death family protein
MIILKLERAIMERMAISEFKATCLAVLERVRRTKKPVLITRFGQPVAEVVPPSAPPRPKSWIGSMAGTGKILGDIVSPIADKSDWEAAG